MNQIDAILKNFDTWNKFCGIEYLWLCCDGGTTTEDYPDVEFEYDPDTAFFMALERLLKSGETCLFYVQFDNQPKSYQLLTETPDEQLALLKDVWIGKAAMDKLDEENDYLGWYFLAICPYSFMHKMYEEDGSFLKWFAQ